MPVTNQTLAQRRFDAVPRGVGQSTQIYTARAQNAEIWDVEGRRLIDFGAGIAVVNTGPNPSRLAQEKQGDRGVGCLARE